MKKTTLSAALALAFVISAPAWAYGYYDGYYDGWGWGGADAYDDSVANSNTSNEQIDNYKGAQAQNHSYASVDNKKDFGNTTVAATTALTGTVKNNNATQGNTAGGGSADAYAGGKSGKADAHAISGGGGWYGYDDGWGYYGAGRGALAAATSGNANGGSATAYANGDAGTYYVSNCISDSYSTGISNISQNNGANSLIQQGVTVQANVTIR